MKTKTLYVCETCQNESEDRAEIERCEAGPKVPIKDGDALYYNFKDRDPKNPANMTKMEISSLSISSMNHFISVSLKALDRNWLRQGGSVNYGGPIKPFYRKEGEKFVPVG